MPVKLQSNCLNIPVTFNCYQTAGKLIFNRPQLLMPQCLKAEPRFDCSEPFLQQWHPQGRTFVSSKQHPQMRITRGLQSSTNTCTVTVTHKLKTTQNHCLQFYHKVPGCVNLSPISCSLLRLHCTLKATLCEARGSTKWPAQEQSQQKGKAVWLRAWPSLNCWAGPSLTVPLGSGALLAARISHSHHWLLDP